MVKRSRQFYQARARVAKALAHPSRLLIVDALKEKDWCVCELTELVGADQSTVSKHLAVLKNAGIVEDRKEGSSNFYRLRIHCLDGFFGCMESVLEEDLRGRAAQMAHR